MTKYNTDLIKRAEKATRLLEAKFGEPRWEGKSDPLDSLVKTVLSQNTNDNNRDLAYARLRERFPAWRDVMVAPREEVVEAIRPAGLGNQKSGRLIEILRWVDETYGELSLDFLHKMPTDEAIETFTKLKGIGIKTIAVVLMFACGRDVFPVDTHVHRISRRLGLVPQGADAVKTYHLMAPLVPEGKSYSLHMNLLRLGRTVCTARNPTCRKCPLHDLCPWPGRISQN